MSQAVQRVYERIRARMWDREADDDDESLLSQLTPVERAIYVTRELEDQIAEGGWYLVFADENDSLIQPAIEGYELLGLPRYAAHLREVLASGYGDDSSEDEGERLDALYARLRGAERARATAIRVHKLA